MSALAMLESPRIKLVAINARYTHSCLALFCIRHELETHLPDHLSTLYQFSINEAYHEMVLRLTEGEPDAIFISAAIWNSDIVVKLVKDLRICLPDCQLVVGGPQADVIHGACAGICSVVFGEIEGIESEFYSDLVHRRLKDVYRGTFKKAMAKGLPTVYRQSDYADYLENRHIYYESSRGCPFSCTYCLSAAEVGVFHKDIEQVKSELQQMLLHKPKVLRFIDRTYNDNWRRALEIWKFLMQCDGDTLYHFEIAPDLFTEEMFSFLKTVPPGRFQFEIGVQSTNRETLEAIRRKINPEQVHEIISRLAAMDNIHLHVDLILGLPFETEEIFFKSFEDVFAMGAHYIQMGLLKMLPHTPICNDVEKFEYRYSLAAPYCVYQNCWLDHPRLTELYWFCECVEKFLNNRFFVSLWTYLRQTGEAVAPIFVEILKHARQEKLFDLAATQKLMCEILMNWGATRGDRDIIRDLLRYDWLRCGQKMFPDCLQLEKDAESFLETRDRLYKILPEEVLDVYVKRERNRFFKRGIFWNCSQQLLLFLGYPNNGKSGCLCFILEREESLHRFNKTILLRPVD